MRHLTSLFGVLCLSLCALSLTAWAGEPQCDLKLKLSTDQAHELKAKLLKVKADVKARLGSIPDKCPSDIQAYQDGDDYLTRLTPVQIERVKAKYPNMGQAPEGVVFKVAELWGKSIDTKAYICVIEAEGAVTWSGEVEK